MRIARDLRVVLEARGAPFDLVEVLDARFAAFERQQPRQLRATAAQQACGIVKELASFERRQTGPMPRRPRCGLTRARDVCWLGVSHLIYGFERCRVDDWPPAHELDYGTRFAP